MIPAIQVLHRGLRRPQELHGQAKLPRILQACTSDLLGNYYMAPRRFLDDYGVHPLDTSMTSCICESVTAADHLSESLSSLRSYDLVLTRRNQHHAQIGAYHESLTWRPCLRMR